MEQLFDQPLLEVGKESYCWGDAILLAMMTGRWNRLAREIHEGLACVIHSEATGAEEPEAAIDDFAAEFRYERDLITAEEAENWLAARNLDADQWLGWARREALRRAWAANVEQLIRDNPVSEAEILAAAPLDLLCGVRGRELATDLAVRAAAAVAVAEPESSTGAELPEGLADRIRSRLPGIDSGAFQPRLVHLARLERGYARFRALAPTPARIQRELEIGRLEWVRLDCRVIKFETETLAREAVLCVREDGLGVDQVARDAHAVVHEMRFFLGELDPALRPALLAATTQELIGPVPFEEGYALFLVLDKLLPDERTPDVRREVERRAISRAETEQVDRLVRWLAR